jgi:ketosteroid isomerase-like protein
MKRLIPILFALALTLQTRAAESAKEAIERLNKIFVEAHIKGDAKTIAGQYSKDAQCLWEDEPIFSGRENIEAAWKKLIGDGGRKADVKTLEVQEAGDWAYEVGAFIITEKDDVIYDGKYIIVWKKEDGQWRIHRDIGNGNRAIPPKK